MVDHIKPVTRDKPDHIIFHIGTNNITSYKNAEDIAKSMVNLAFSVKSLISDVSIFSIITRKDKHQ